MTRSIAKALTLAVSLVAWSPGARGQGTISLPKTGQTLCYAATGEVIACAGTGQDGEIQAGVAWPSPRYVTSGACFTDQLTGLMWKVDGFLNTSSVPWASAIAAANALSLCGFTDWRTPNINEWYSLKHSGTECTSLTLPSPAFGGPVNAWSSTTVSGSSANAYGGNYCRMPIGLWPKTDSLGDWPVRGGPNGAPSVAYPANVPKTGQTTSYTAGDDGDLEWGITWPTPRFTENGNSTVTDNLTGLTWTRDMSTPGPAACTPGVRKEWQASLDHVKCLNTNSYLGYTNWRLPNVNEMRSLIDYERTSPALPVGHPFTNVVSAGFWTSTTQISSNNRGGWVVNTINGTTVEGGKHTTQINWAWPVRHGPIQPPCSDGDGDGYGNPGNASCPNGAQTDCNDGNPSIFPGAAESCDGVDNDCDGTVDDGFNVGTSCSVGVGQCLRDGTRICNATGNGTICNATPGTPVAEICNGLDDDCDGTADDGNPGGGGSCPTGVPGICALGTLSCSAASLQCSQTIFPAVELCNGLDDDCDGTSDEGASDAPTWYADADSDTYGNPAASQLQCTQPAGYVSNSQDCDDANPAVGICNSPVSPDPKTFDDPAGNASVTLPNVTAPGDTTITSAPCAAPPTGIFTPPNPLCIDIDTTASFSGDAEVCIRYDDTGLSLAQEQNLRMVRYPDAAGCAAEQKPFPCPEALPLSGPLGPPPAVDTVNDIICATTDRFSEFAVGVLTDVDGDFVQDLFDNCPLTVNFFQEDGDADGAGDVCDNCRVFANPTQADVNANGIGNACECGDQTGDGRVNVQDLVAINLAIFTPSLATPLCDTNNDGQCNVADIVGANLKIFGRPAYCSRYPPPGP